MRKQTQKVKYKSQEKILSNALKKELYNDMKLACKLKDNNRAVNILEKLMNMQHHNHLLDRICNEILFNDNCIYTSKLSKLYKKIIDIVPINENQILYDFFSSNKILLILRLIYKKYDINYQLNGYTSFGTFIPNYGGWTTIYWRKSDTVLMSSMNNSSPIQYLKYRQRKLINQNCNVVLRNNSNESFFDIAINKKNSYLLKMYYLRQFKNKN